MAKVNYETIGKKSEQVRQLVNETAGAAMTISPNKEGWGAYVLQQKAKFQNDTQEGLYDELIEYIETNRIAVEKPAKETKREIKPFKLDK